MTSVDCNVASFCGASGNSTLHIAQMSLMTCWTCYIPAQVKSNDIADVAALAMAEGQAFGRAVLATSIGRASRFWPRISHAAAARIIFGLVLEEVEQ